MRIPRILGNIGWKLKCLLDIKKWEVHESTLVIKCNERLSTQERKLKSILSSHQFYWSKFATRFFLKFLFPKIFIEFY